MFGHRCVLCFGAGFLLLPWANTGKWVPELVELPVEDIETEMRNIEIITATWVDRGANMRSNI